MERAILVGLITPEQSEERTNEYLDELAFLADTREIIPVKRFVQRLNGPDTNTYVGSGKLQEIRQFIIDDNHNHNDNEKESSRCRFRTSRTDICR